MLDISTVLEMLGTSVMGVPVFKRATTGAVQIWRIERDGNRFRTIHGQFDGAQITSDWTICEGKNIGKKNETSPEKQAELEVEALYKKKTAQGKYVYDFGEIDVATYISPMLAQKYTPKKVQYPCIVQPKLDGIRCIASKSGFYTRQGKPIPVVRHLVESLAPIFEENPDLILDGELYNHEYKDAFEELVSAIRQQKPTEEDFKKAKEVVTYHVYDCPSQQGGYDARYAAITDALGYEGLSLNGPYGVSTLCPYVYKVDYWSGVDDEQRIRTIAAMCLEQGYEGAMIRDENTEYENKRTYQLMKYKEFTDEEFEVIDIEEGNGNWSGYAKVVKLWLNGADRSKGVILPDDSRVASGEEVATAFRATVKGSKTYAKKLLENKADVIGKKATVTFFRYTNTNNVPYLPIFKVIRDYE